MSIRKVAVHAEGIPGSVHLEAVTNATISILSQLGLTAKGAIPKLEVAAKDGFRRTLATDFAIVHKTVLLVVMLFKKPRR